MQSESRAKPRIKYGRYFFFGALFELLLIVSMMGIPGGNLAIEIANFAFITQFPLRMIQDQFGGSVFVLVMGFLLMASIWGLLFFLIARLAGWMRKRLTRGQKLVLGVVVGLGVTVWLAQAILASLPQNPIPFEPSPEVKTLVDGNNAFALDLYQKLRVRDGNLFFSPFSVSSALAMTSAGARGQTELEMTNVLRFNLPPAKLHPAFQTLMARMDQIQRWNRITLKVANSLWGQRDYPFSPDFLKLLPEKYSAEAKSVDFKNSSTVAAEMNHWIDSKTEHRIHSGVEPGQLTPDTRLALCDAIYFKGKWKNQFKEKDTHPAPFHISTNETVTVPMMGRTAEFKSARSEDESVEMVELPYSGQDLSMVILMPSEYVPEAEHNDIFAVEQNLTLDTLRPWLTTLDKANPRELQVELPRFTTTSSFDLVKDLKALGMTSAFDATADFSGMDGTKNLYLADVFQKAFVEVNEEGTEAAAVTWALVNTKGGPDIFCVDRPFIFLIRENGSGSILFLGRIIDPTK
jgi:serpin B